MSNILTAQRLQQISQFHPNLKNFWYLIAAVTFSVCNAPQEIPLIYHYALMLKNNTEEANVANLGQKTMNIFQTSSSNIRMNIDQMYVIENNMDKRLTEKFREAILKTGPLAGLPKAINSLSALAEVTPSKLLPKPDHIDPLNDDICHDNTYEKSVMRLKSNDSTEESSIELTKRGMEHWNKLYNKVSSRVANNMNSMYPDLWHYTLKHVYGPLLSFGDIVSAQETSLIIIAALIPQDVNPQLRGHLRGALNVGCEPETVAATRNLVIMISQWCNVSWKLDVAKL